MLDGIFLVKPFFFPLPSTGIEDNRVSLRYLHRYSFKGHKYAALEVRHWHIHDGYSEWQQVKTMTLVEAATFLNNAGVGITAGKKGGVYVDRKNNEYRFIPVLH